MNANPYADRLAALAARAAELKLDAVLILTEFNRLAVTGVDCDNGCLVVEPGKRTRLYTDSRYTVMASRVAPWLWCSGDWYGKKMNEVIEKIHKGWKRVGYEGLISASRYLSLKKLMPGVKLVDITDECAKLRAVKTPDEIGKLRAAEAMTDRVWAETQKKIHPGMTEKAIQRVVRSLMNELGDGEAFTTIDCAGLNAAECHHVPDETVWQKNEPLLCDLGIRLGGFCSDMTRNVVPARPSPLYKKIYRIVLQANKEAIDAVKPGAVCGDIDAIARRVIGDAGYGPCFGHGLGHGVGLEIHESPYFSRGQTTVLKPGMLITVEPGIYIAGKLGVRIEDLVLVTETGHEVLSHSPKDLL